MSISRQTSFRNAADAAALAGARLSLGPGLMLETLPQIAALNKAAKSR